MVAARGSARAMASHRGVIAHARLPAFRSRRGRTPSHEHRIARGEHRAAFLAASADDGCILAERVRRRGVCRPSAQRRVGCVDFGARERPEHAVLVAHHAGLPAMGGKTGRWPLRAEIVLAFAVGLMSKAMLVTLPCTLLLLDRWPLRRMRCSGVPATPGACDFKRLLWEKAPLFALSAASSVVTFLVVKGGGGVASYAQIGWDVCIANVLVAYAKYLRRMVWPSDLGLFLSSPRHAVTCDGLWSERAPRGCDGVCGHEGAAAAVVAGRLAVVSRRAFPGGGAHPIRRYRNDGPVR